MGCRGRISKFMTVLVQVLVIKITFSGFDVASDAFTASELAGYGSPLGTARRFLVLV